MFFLKKRHAFKVQEIAKGFILFVTSIIKRLKVSLVKLAFPFFAGKCWLLLIFQVEWAVLFP